MTMHTIEELDRSGHLLLTWDSDIPESVDRALQDFQRLREQGYEFFRAIDHSPAQVFTPTDGALEIRHITPAEAAPKLEGPVEPVAVDEPVKRGRGRPRKTEQLVAAPTTKERTVAMRPARGG